MPWLKAREISADLAIESKVVVLPDPSMPTSAMVLRFVSSDNNSASARLRGVSGECEKSMAWSEPLGILETDGMVAREVFRRRETTFPMLVCEKRGMD